MVGSLAMLETKVRGATAGDKTAKGNKVSQEGLDQVWTEMRES